MNNNDQDFEENKDKDYYSPTDWEREPGESDEDYKERIEDLESYMESYD